MPTVQIIINILLVIASVLLVVTVLLQDAKTAGLGSAFGNDTTALGRSRNQKASREAKLQKVTVILAIAIGVLALVALILS
ncbi:MAG: preprotein translocase subunit SecG [Clostridia bacterium]|nr:preprotein translocase subunit SecG [Clostridia bacterium]